jgi:two-component system, NtrC family, response regulator AtoC
MAHGIVVPGGLPMRRVLVLNDDENARRTLQLKLRGDGYETTGVGSLGAARRALEAERFAYVLVSAPLGSEGQWRLGPPGSGPTVIAILPPGSDVTAGLRAISEGAHDFVIDGPQLADAAALALHKAEARSSRPAPIVAPERSGRAANAPLPMVGKSPPMLALGVAIRKVAPYKATVLVLGESGTGKELIARALHELSPRAEGPFVAVNCGAIPAGLIESELLGHSKGAFTDALRDRIGLLEQASGGTLFLDEIAELPLALQVKLLRVLQEDQVRRLGDTEERPVDVRMVAATARDLEAEVAAGRFRDDLFHRINVVGLRVPPLRERAGDIPLLVEYFLERINLRLGLGVGGISPDAMRVMVGYGWPGNVRELENTVERAAVMCEARAIDLPSLPERLLRGKPGATAAGTAAEGNSPWAMDAAEDLSIKRTARRAEEELIRRALARTGGNRTRAAELLEISHRSLLYKIKEYGVSLPIGGLGPPKT